MALLASAARDVAEVTLEQRGVRNDLARAAILVIVDGEGLPVRAAVLPVIVRSGVEPALMELGQQIELVDVDLGPALAERAVEKVGDRLGGDAAVADRGRQEMRPDGVAAGEVLRHFPDLIDRVDCDRAAAAVEPLEPFGEVGHLADRRDDHVARDLGFRPLDRNRRHALHRALADFQRDGEAVRVLDDLEGHHPAEDLDAFAHCVLPLTLGGGHLLDGKERGEDGVHAFASQSARDVGARCGRFPRWSRSRGRRSG